MKVSELFKQIEELNLSPDDEIKFNKENGFTYEIKNKTRLKLYRVFVTNHVTKQVDQECYCSFEGGDDVLEQVKRKYNKSELLPIDESKVKKLFFVCCIKHYGDKDLWVSEPEFVRYGAMPEDIAEGYHILNKSWMFPWNR